MSPIDLELFGYIKSPAAGSLERELHKIFRDRRIRSEWFKLFLEDIDFIKEHYDFIEARGFYYNGRYCIRKVRYTQSLDGWHDKATFDYRTMDSLYAASATEGITAEGDIFLSSSSNNNKYLNVIQSSGGLS